MTFPMKMFAGVAKLLNIVCYFLKDPNYIKDGKKLYILIRTPYSFQPGQT